MPYTIADIAKRLGGEVLGDASLVLKGFAPADRAQPGFAFTFDFDSP